MGATSGNLLRRGARSAKPTTPLANVAEVQHGVGGHDRPSQNDRDDSEAVAYCRGPYCVYADDAVRELCRRGYRARRPVDGFPEWERAGLSVAQGAESEGRDQ